MNNSGGCINKSRHMFQCFAMILPQQNAIYAIFVSAMRNDYLCVMLSEREMMIRAKNNAFIFYFLALTSSSVFTWRYPGRICTFFSVVV